MSDEAEDDKLKAKEGEDAAAEGEAQETEGGGRFNFKIWPPDRKMMMIAAVPVLLLIAGAGYFVSGMFGGSDDVVAPKKLVYYDLPEMVVNLSSSEKRAQYLKLKVSLEAENQHAIAALDPVMPRVLDMFQLYLRELRSTDLNGSAGIFRLKEELLRRVNLEVHPHKVTRVLFKEIIVQ
jgi:flagellar FliL protein